MSHWQDIVVLCLIAGAAVYLARILWSRMTKRANACCATCPGCGATSGEKGEAADLPPLTVSTPNRSASEE